MPTLTTHALRPTIELSEVELRALAGIAYNYGWQREHPRKSWTRREYLEAARFAVQHLVHDAIGNKQ